MLVFTVVTASLNLVTWDDEDKLIIEYIQLGSLGIAFTVECLLLFYTIILVIIGVFKSAARICAKTKKKKTSKEQEIENVKSIQEVKSEIISVNLKRRMIKS